MSNDTEEPELEQEPWDLAEIAYQAIQSLADQVDEIAIDKPSNTNFDERYVIIVSEGLVSQSREDELEKLPYWYSEIEVAVCGPGKKQCKMLCLEAFQLIINHFHTLVQNGVGPIYGLARGTKEIGVATHGGFPIDGYCARRTLDVHNSLEP